MSDCVYPECQTLFKKRSVWSRHGSSGECSCAHTHLYTQIQACMRDTHTHRDMSMPYTFLQTYTHSTNTSKHVQSCTHMGGPPNYPHRHAETCTRHTYAQRQVCMLMHAKAGLEFLSRLLPPCSIMGPLVEWTGDALGWLTSKRREADNIDFTSNNFHMPAHWPTPFLQAPSLPPIGAASRSF